MEAMIRGYHEYKKANPCSYRKTVKSSCSFHANRRCTSFIIQGAHKRLAAPDYVTLNKVEIGKKTWQIVAICQFAIFLLYRLLLKSVITKAQEYEGSLKLKIYVAMCSLVTSLNSHDFLRHQQVQYYQQW